MAESLTNWKVASAQRAVDAVVEGDKELEDVLAALEEVKAHVQSRIDTLEKAKKIVE